MLLTEIIAWYPVHYFCEDNSVKVIESYIHYTYGMED